MNDDNLLDELKQAATPAPPKNFRPGVIYSGRYPSEIVTPPLESMETEEEWEEAVKAMGIVLPPDHTLALVEAQYVYHDNFWTRENQGDDALTKPSHSWRYRFKVVPRSARADTDIAALIEEVKAETHGLRVGEVTPGKRSKIINLADYQVGKTDILGGTRELLLRNEQALQMAIEDVRNWCYEEIILVDPGDSTEGFNSAPNAARTNDLQETEAIRVWRRILMRWIREMAPHTPSLKVVGVPSNHCRVRKGKDVQGDPLDDWGIEVIAQVSDIVSENPERYDHVEFIIPRHHEEHVLLTLVGGKVLGVAHGHQKASPNQLTEWVKSTGRNGLAQADVVVVGHFHHLRIVEFGDKQTLFVCPTMDNGSSWFTPSSGESSDPGVLTFTVYPNGWGDLQILRPSI